jgi:AbrB family looped-hinge helix DNA binding protein
MLLARSKVTSQGKISVPVEVRRKLGIGPGSVLEWNEERSQIIVRRAGRFSSEDIHCALFPAQSPEHRTPEELKDGIRRHVRERYAHHRH